MTTFVSQSAPGRGGTGFPGTERPLDGSVSSSSSSLSIPASAMAMTNASASLKRRSSPSSELESTDCHTLQSSLKRVRLSISPGELRLQRDLGALTSMGWQLLGNDPSQTGAEAPQHQQKQKHPPAHFTVDQSPRWYFGSSSLQDLEAELHLLDPLRLVLHLRRASAPQDVGRIWIQIPRMYPHRPPVVSRTENLWMERVVVLEAHPAGMGGPADTHGETREAMHQSSVDFSTPAGSSLSSSTSSPPSLSTTKTVVYNQWSPVQGLGELLHFLMSSSVDHPDSQRQQSPSPTSSAAARAQSNPTNAPGALAGLPSSNNTFFLEEHKMEDAHTLCNHSNPHHDYQSQQNPANQNNKFTATFAPNRFDVGYGKYHNPMDHHRSVSQNNHQTFGTGFSRAGTTASFTHAATSDSSTPRWPTAAGPGVFLHHPSNPQQHEMAMDF